MGARRATNGHHRPHHASMDVRNWLRRWLQRLEMSRRLTRPLMTPLLLALPSHPAVASFAIQRLYDDYGADLLAIRRSPRRWTPSRRSPARNCWPVPISPTSRSVIR
ncbi:hypothetical protein GCM10022248_89370 [Nonomuraea soli]